MNFAIPTHNRFEIFRERENQICQNPPRMQVFQNNNDADRQNFVSSTIDNKLTMLFDEVRNVRTEQIDCNRRLAGFENMISGIGKTLSEVINITNSQTDFMKTLAYKSIDIEARSRRNNLIFRGILENRGENCFQLVRDVLENHLDLDTNRIYIARAHRLGKTHSNRQFQRRPIIVNFRDYCDIEMIMGNVTRLKGTGISIDYDFPKEIQEARSRLWSTYKDLKKAGGEARIQIVYPAKLLKNGKLVRDELPGWSEHVSANRIDQLEKISYEQPVRPTDAQCMPIQMNLPANQVPLGPNTHSQTQYPHVTPQMLNPVTQVPMDTTQTVWTDRRPCPQATVFMDPSTVLPPQVHTSATDGALSSTQTHVLIPTARTSSPQVPVPVVSEPTYTADNMLVSTHERMIASSIPVLPVPHAPLAPYPVVCSTADSMLTTTNVNMQAYTTIGPQAPVTVCAKVPSTADNMASAQLQVMSTNPSQPGASQSTAVLRPGVLMSHADLGNAGSRNVLTDFSQYSCTDTNQSPINLSVMPNTSTGHIVTNTHTTLGSGLDLPVLTTQTTDPMITQPGVSDMQTQSENTILKTISSPERSRSRDVRVKSRAEKRSASARPYKNQPRSESRASKNRPHKGGQSDATVFPGAINSQNTAHN